MPIDVEFPVIGSKRLTLHRTNRFGGGCVRCSSSRWLLVFGVDDEDMFAIVATVLEDCADPVRFDYVSLGECTNNAWVMMTMMMMTAYIAASISSKHSEIHNK
jgi:hypothetical protein